MHEDARGVYDVLSPEGPSRVVGIDATPACDDLDNAVVAQVWNSMFRGDVVFSYLREALAGRHPGIRFVDHTVFGNIHGPEQDELTAELPERLRAHGCSAAMVGIGA